VASIRRVGGRNDLRTQARYNGRQMIGLLHSLRRRLASRDRPAPAAGMRSMPASSEPVPLDIAPNDPLVAYFESASGAVDVDSLELASPALEALRAAGVKLVVPLVSQGELIGLLNLGPRLSDQEYSGDDRRLLDSLAAQAAPALRVGQLVREQEGQARERERIERELELARVIQQNFLPRELPELPGWQVSAFYRPAREVGGDFYDVIALGDGRIGLVVGDVTDKGVPAAMVMAATRSLLRAAALRLDSPGAVLERVNELLCPDIPPKMFVTCLYAVLEPETGRLSFANAGHNLPCLRTAAEVLELRATGMPLGLMPGTTYEEREAVAAPGDRLLLYSDGLVEAHGAGREMFGMPRLRALVADAAEDASLIDGLLAALDGFTGSEWEQEDDITIVALSRSLVAMATAVNGRVLASFEIASVLGNEREAIDRVSEAVAGLAIPARTLERVRTAVAETAMNAIEHGNRGRAELPVAVEVEADGDELRVRITDLGGERTPAEAEQPDLDAKLEGRQTPRGWGLFLVRHMVDALETATEGDRHTVELAFRLRGGADADEPV
jgi:serine phosphatase RsbU (regulator of sigma subunit)/anti-sigma regulatory factor (Ser/Thr protein kinase)